MSHLYCLVIISTDCCCIIIVFVILLGGGMDVLFPCSLKQPKKICWIVDYNLSTTCHHMQPYDKARNAVALALSPVVRALIDPDGAMVDIRNLDSVRTISFLLLLPCYFIYTR